ncbi:7-methyl-GTP pyrophosphatase isoform X1 [Dendrobium catenatum]|uniref:7-methyl-GTP pyrophosphatase isoform X1 n=1 Tax=Dendrobium catenatum TaxID=906689 RepID=UPI0009F403DC|nr:7-methyl-GTP pyrophosphatase isoform X1 [Dendrobium catenatum]
MTSKDSPSFKIILGSSSSSRRQILSDMGYEFSIMAADIDEKQIRMEKPEELVMALAEAKADAIISKLQINEFTEKDEPTLLITADQSTRKPNCVTILDFARDWHFSIYVAIFLKVVVHGGKIREKPSSREEAREFIKGYSEGHAATVGSVVVTNLKTSARQRGWDKAEVYFHKIPDEVIENLVNEGDVLYVAGGLLVEHPLTSPFVEAMVGTLDSIMGLPKHLTERLIQDAL